MDEGEVRQSPASDSRRRTTRRKRRRRRRRRRLVIPAPVAFYGTAGLSAVSFALAYVKGNGFIGCSVGSCLLILTVLIINERVGFAASRRLRRSHEARGKFSELEVVALFGLLMLGLFVSLYAWAT
jgi:hypothetical protein